MPFCSESLEMLKGSVSGKFQKERTGTRLCHFLDFVPYIEFLSLLSWWIQIDADECFLVIF